MIESNQSTFPSVPMQQLAEFANSLFGYLYLQIGTHQQTFRHSDHFKEIISKAVFHVERITYKFNNQVLDRCCFDVDRSALCQKICAAYPNFDYFNKLYYSSAFILDLVLWWNRHKETADLSEGPKLWVELFQKNFEGVFEDKGGWFGFAEAGKVLLERAHKDGSILPRDALLPSYLLTVMSQLESLIPKCDETPYINMLNIGEAAMSLKYASMKVVDDHNMETEEIGGNPTEKVDEDVDLPLHAAMETELGGKIRQKRRHGADSSDSDSDMDSPSPSKPKLDRKFFKRKFYKTG